MKVCNDEINVASIRRFLRAAHRCVASVSSGQPSCQFRQVSNFPAVMAAPDIQNAARALFENVLHHICLALAGHAKAVVIMKPLGLFEIQVIAAIIEGLQELGTPASTFRNNIMLFAKEGLSRAGVAASPNTPAKERNHSRAILRAARSGLIWHGSGNCPRLTSCFL